MLPYDLLLAGAKLLLYTLPILIIAVLGCIYLHRVKKSNYSNMERCNLFLILQPHFNFSYSLAMSVSAKYFEVFCKIGQIQFWFQFYGFWTTRCNNGKKREVVPMWKRPVLVRGPLGIVSGTELVFLFMFIVLLVWSLSTYLHNSFAKVSQKSAAEDGVKV